MAHFNYTDIAAEISKSSWGAEFSSREEAARAMIKDPAKLSAFAALELLKRLGGGERVERDRTLTKPSNAKAFPNKLVGDKLYHGDLEEGISESVIVAKDDEGYCLICDSYINEMYPPACHYACDFHSETLRDEIQRIAKNDVDYHEPRLAFAKAALLALDAGEDVSRFAEGFVEP